MGMVIERECAIQNIGSSSNYLATPLRYASSALQNDKDIVRDAIYHSYEACFYASSEQRSNQDIVFEALE